MYLKMANVIKSRFIFTKLPNFKCEKPLDIQKPISILYWENYHIYLYTSQQDFDIQLSRVTNLINFM